MTMKNAVNWDIKPSSYLTGDTLSPRYRAQPVNECYVSFDVSTAMTVKNIVFRDIEPSSYLTRDTLRLRYRTQRVNAM
jgi:hypothetical protein